jgi:hypothetical protein
VPAVQIAAEISQYAYSTLTFSSPQYMTAEHVGHSYNYGNQDRSSAMTSNPYGRQPSYTEHCALSILVGNPKIVAMRTSYRIKTRLSEVQIISEQRKFPAMKTQIFAPPSPIPLKVKLSL